MARDEPGGEQHLDAGRIHFARAEKIRGAVLEALKWHFEQFIDWEEMQERLEKNVKSEQGSQDYEKVKELVAEQLKAMQNGKFDDKDIEIAKLMIKNALVRTKDEPISQIALLFNKNITHKEETDEEYISKIMAVSKQDIIDVCQSMTLDTIFLLKGRDE